MKTNHFSLFESSKLWVKKAAIAFIKGYQIALSPFLGTNCRFYPTCSNYFIEAIETHGFIKGGFLGVKRLLKCHPWHQGGLDPVPEVTINCGCEPRLSAKNHKTSGTTT